jgi:hypothetical protein
MAVGAHWGEEGRREEEKGGGNVVVMRFNSPENGLRQV